MLVGLIACAPEVRQELLIDKTIFLVSGEVTSSSVILQGRFAVTDTLVHNDIPGQNASGCFQPRFLFY